MSLQSTYANKKSDYQNTFNSLQKVKAGKPRQLKYKHITFCNLSAKKRLDCTTTTYPPFTIRCHQTVSFQNLHIKSRLNAYRRSAMASTPVSRLATLDSFPWCRSQDRTVISPFGFPFRGTGPLGANFNL